MKRRNNRGSSIVLVIVVLAIIGILASVSLWMSLRNFQMKVTDSKIKDSFYSAESVLDQICVGLQEKVSDAYGKAYIEIMQDYDADAARSVRESNFKSLFIDELKSELSGANSNEYDPDKITSLVYASAIDGADRVIVECNNPRMIVENGEGKYSITLCNIEVSYTDINEMVSMIETDINIAAPTFGSISAAALPDIFSFSLIANSGIVVKNPEIVIEGNVYAGSPSIFDSSKSDVAISIDGHADVVFANNDYIIADGRVTIDGPSTRKPYDITVTSDNTQFWTKDIRLNSATGIFNGSMYVADDLTLAGRNSSVTMSGKYFGYGADATDASKSSAIILNGQKSTLDMKNVNELVVAGYSYIGSNIFPSGDPNVRNKNVLMGESISVKSNQFAYLVPSKCIGTESDAVDASSILGRNPITQAEYLSFTAESGANYTKTLVNTALLYQETGIENVENYVRKVFDNSNHLVYFYLNLPEDVAEDYFAEYPNKNPDGKDKLALYMNYYAQSVQLPGAAARINTAGTSLSYDGTNVSYREGSSVSEIRSRVSRMASTYNNLTTSLSPNFSSVTASMENHKVFDNFMNTQKINELVSGISGDGVFLLNIVEDDAGNKKAYVVYVYAKNQVFNSSILNSIPGLDASIPVEMCLIICPGNKEVRFDQNNLNCMVITNGTVELMGASMNIKPMNQEKVRNILAATYDKNGTVYTAYELFKNGNISWIGGADNSTPSGAEIKSYSEMITFRNWKKK